MTDPALRLPLEEAPELLLDHEFVLEAGTLHHDIRVGGTVRRSSIEARGRVGSDLAGAWWKGYLKGVRPDFTGERARPVRVVELFSGSGGLALGFGQACDELGIPWSSSAAVDQDRDALAVYARHNSTRFPLAVSASSLTDYRTRGVGSECEFLYPPEVVHSEMARLVGQVEVVLAGPPCQGHSNLNNHTRRTDRRNELYLTVPALAVALGAPTIVIENVAAVVHDSRQVVQSTVALLRSAGYELSVGVLRAASMGWPQRRERFFLVASKHAAPVPLEVVGTALRQDARSAWWALGGRPRTKRDHFMDQLPDTSAENRRRIDFLFDNDLHDLPDHQRPDCHKDGNTYGSVYGRIRKDQPVQTITTGFMTPGRGRYIHPTERRVLTPREAARLQGFPDTYDFRRADGSAPSKAQLGKWIGDAVPMPLGYAASLAALAPSLT